VIFERKSQRFLLLAALEVAALALMLADAARRRAESEPQIALRARVVERLELTDLCFFTDARYARHPAMADLNTAFQDAPLSFEHFPSGSFVAPPPHLRRGMEHPAKQAAEESVR
jgi:hypothetical protein